MLSIFLISLVVLLRAALCLQNLKSCVSSVLLRKGGTPGQQVSLVDPVSLRIRHQNLCRHRFLPAHIPEGSLGSIRRLLCFHNHLMQGSRILIPEDRTAQLRCPLRKQDHIHTGIHKCKIRKYSDGIRKLNVFHPYIAEGMLSDNRQVLRPRLNLLLRGRHHTKLCPAFLQAPVQHSVQTEIRCILLGHDEFFQRSKTAPV